MKEYSSDGCTNWWNGFYNLFCDACRDHDRIYALGKRSGLTRLHADKELCEHVIACSYSPKLSFRERFVVRCCAPVMFAGVRAFGAVEFGPGQKWGYGDVY